MTPAAPEPLVMLFFLLVAAFLLFLAVFGYV